MKFLSALLMGLLLPLASLAAEHITVTPASVKARMGERESLLKRYEAGETLAPADMAVVYFGQAYTPGYKTQESYPDVDAAYNKKDYALTLTLVEDVLRQNPVALNQLFRGFVAAKSSNEPRLQARAENFQARIMNICNLIYATGTGVTESSPFLTLTNEDASAFTRNYLQPTDILGTAGHGNLFAIKVNYPQQTEPAIFYFGRP